MAATKIRASKQVEIDDNINFNNKKVTNLATPTDPADAVNKSYADALLETLNGYQNKGTLDWVAFLR